MKKIFNFFIICAVVLFTSCTPAGSNPPDDPSEPNTPETPNDTDSSEDSNNNNKKEAVDLGLSVKWATCNVGANAPEEYGDYFAWGEVEAKNIYDWSTYKWYDANDDCLTKYISKDNLTILDKEDDAATVNWGKKWRTPTIKEWLELLNNCSRKWTRQNNVYGYLITSNINGNKIFLPAAGCHLKNKIHKIDDACFYWSSSLLTSDRISAWDVYFSLSEEEWTFYTRCYGQSVRPVCQ